MGSVRRVEEAENNTLRQRWSRRITAPVRWLGGLGNHGGGAFRRGANGLVRVGINLFRRPLTGLMRMVLGQPALSEPLNRLLLRYPPLHQWLLGIARRGGVIPGAPIQRPSPTRNTSPWEPAESAELSALTPRARRIYRELITASEERRASDG